MRHLKDVAVWAVLAMLAGGGGAAWAASINDLTEAAVIAEHLDALNRYTTVFPVVYEDDDFTKVIDDGTSPLDPMDPDGNTPGIPDYIGDRVVGILDITGVFSGLPGDTIDVFRDTVFAGLQRVQKGGPYNAGVNSPELTAIFDLQVTGTTAKFGTSWITFAGGSWTGDTALSAAPTAGTAFVLYEDAAGNFSSGGVWATDKANAIDGTKWAEVGFGGVGTEFYLLALDGSAYAISLNFLTGGPSTPYPVLANEFGTDMVGTGTLLVNAGGAEWYTRTSDGDFKVLFAPVPAAAWLGLPTLGALLLGKLRRR